MLRRCAGSRVGAARAHLEEPVKKCKEGCKNADNDKEKCYKKCDDEAEACEAECRKIPKDDKDRRQKCWEGCNEANGQCKKKCK